PAPSGPISLGAGKQVKARFFSSSSIWSALDDTTFFPSTAPPLRISEIMYNPAQPAVGSVFTKDDFEYIELVNTGASSLDLSGMKFADGITFTFSAGATLGGGERGVIVRNLTAFQLRY